MKSKKFVLAALALLAVITGLLALTGCKNDSVSESHTHTFDENRWKSDATGHWHPATCEHTEEKDGFARHTFDWEVQTPSTDTVAGKLVKKCTTCSEPGGDEMEIPAGFVYIPAGTFQMGSTAGDADEKPVHGVTISKGYFMGRHEVTQQLYFAVMGKNPSYFTSDVATGETQELRPVESVSWYDAVVFCNELTKKVLDEGACVYYSDAGLTTVYTTGDITDGKTPYMDISKSGYRLPTEAEWEYAARAGDDTTNARTWSGTKTEADLGTYAWFGGSNGTSEVGTLDPNAWGLYDMSGNVWEWCWDWYDEKYYSSSTESVTNPTGPTGGSSGDNRVYRGGGWSRSASLCTVSYRDYFDPSVRSSGLGFRLVRPSSK